MDISLIATLIACGIITNMMSAIFGIGGGVLMVPIFLTLFPEFPIQMVAATSLSIVIATACINLVNFIRLHIPLSYKSLCLWSLGMIVGVQLGFELSFFVPRDYIVGFFVLTMIVLSIKTFLKRNTNKECSLPTTKESLKGASFCTIGGAIAGFTGIGGGSIMAPLINQLNFVAKKQVPIYTNYMMVIGGLGSMYGYITKPIDFEASGMLQLGYINLSVVLIVVSASFVTSFFSIKISNLLSPRIANVLLGLILLLIGLYTFVLEIW